MAWVIGVNYLVVAFLILKILLENKNPQKTYPLVVTFHGLNGSPDEMLRITAGIKRDEGTSRLAYVREPTRLRKWGQLIVAPLGYGNVGQRQLGELDVLRVIDYMQEWYNIDSARIYVYGYSMGGLGAFRMAAHYPDIFAAAAPGGACGGSCITAPLENLLNVPVFNQDGTKDRTRIGLTHHVVDRL